MNRKVLLLTLAVLGAFFYYCGKDQNPAGASNTDSNNNQQVVPPAPDSTLDTDNDGIPNYRDPDVDGDGILNGEDPDVDGDGVLNGVDTDIDGDGLVNSLDPDMDGDGIANAQDPDMDGDGIPNATDPDADADGIADSVENVIPPPSVPTNNAQVPLDSLQNNIGTSGIVDGSTQRLATYGVPQYYWGDMYGNGTNTPLVMITHAVSDSVVDIELTFNPGFVDNTYGTNGIGWNPRRPHTFRDLYVSDHVELSLMDANGKEVWHGCLDLLSASTAAPSGYACLGPNGGDGNITVGSKDDVISFGSSLDDNINFYNYRLFENSPQTDSIYTPNPQYPFWEYRVIYRISVDPDIFGTAGYGSVYMTYVHASPSKHLSTVTVKEGPPPPDTSNPFIPVVPMPTPSPTPPDTGHLPNPTPSLTPSPTPPDTGHMPTPIPSNSPTPSVVPSPTPSDQGNLPTPTPSAPGDTLPPG